MVVLIKTCKCGKVVAEEQTEGQGGKCSVCKQPYLYHLDEGPMKNVPEPPVLQRAGTFPTFPKETTVKKSSHPWIALGRDTEYWEDYPTHGMSKDELFVFRQLLGAHHLERAIEEIDMENEDEYDPVIDLTHSSDESEDEEIDVEDATDDELS